VLVVIKSVIVSVSFIQVVFIFPGGLFFTVYPGEPVTNPGQFERMDVLSRSALENASPAPVFRQQMVGTARGFTSGCLFFPLSYL
jgi:hypothetical protein